MLSLPIQHPAKCYRLHSPNRFRPATCSSPSSTVDPESTTPFPSCPFSASLKGFISSPPSSPALNEPFRGADRPVPLGGKWYENLGTSWNPSTAKSSCRWSLKSRVGGGSSLVGLVLRDAGAGVGGAFGPCRVRLAAERALMVNTTERLYSSVIISRRIQNAVVLVRCAAGWERNNTHIAAPHICVRRTVSSVNAISRRTRSFVESNVGDRARQRHRMRVRVRIPSRDAERPIHSIATTWEGTLILRLEKD